MANQPNTQAAEAHNFVAVLTQLRRGMAVADLSEALRDLVAQVRDTRKTGSLTLKLKIAPQSKGDDVVLILSDDISLKAPVAERGNSIFYATEGNDLVRNDPRQTEFGFGVVEGAKPVLATTAPATVAAMR